MQAPNTQLLALDQPLDELITWLDVPTNDGTESTVWLTPNACLMRSHMPQPEDEPAVVNVVGIGNSDDLTGWVLMLG